jgi:hypothetical protein
MPYNLISTIGLEFETDNLFPNQLSRDFFNGFSTTRDSSIESRIIQSGLFKIKFDPNKSNIRLFPTSRTNIMGTEIVSVPIDTEVPYLPILKRLTTGLQNLGETEKSYRAGIHYHINFNYSLSILKSVLRLARHLEDIFFLLGGNGYKYRGEITDGVHCRPITKFGPPCVTNYEGDLSQIFVLDDLLEAETIPAFWRRYGYVSPDNYNRHHPVRYHWINLLSLLAHSTLEFRVFNKTLNPYYMWAEIEFCKAFSQYCLGNNYNEFQKRNLISENSVFDNRSKEEIINTFLEFSSICSLDKEVENILKTIMLRTPVPNIRPGYIHSHLRFTHNMTLDRSYFDSNYCPPSISSSQVRKPEFEEI